MRVFLQPKNAIFYHMIHFYTENKYLHIAYDWTTGCLISDCAKKLFFDLEQT